MSKFSNILTMILVVLIVAILGVVGYFAYDTLNAKKIDNNAQSALDEFENATKVVKKKVNKNDQNEVSNETSSSLEDIANQLATDEENKRAEEEKNKEEKEPEVAYYEGYEIKGKIEIPATKVNYPVLESVTKKSLEIAVGIAYGPGLNEVGNTSIYGHNYRNGTFFSNNKKLKNGDEIKITDQKGEEVTYIIYKIYETDANDATYMTRDTQGRREISLQTCTDDSKARIIIWAAEKGSEVPQQ